MCFNKSNPEPIKSLCSFLKSRFKLNITFTLMYSIKRERQLGFIYLYIHQVVSLAVNPKTNIKCPFKQNQYPKVRRSMSNLSHGLVLISLQCPGAGLLSSEAGQGPRNQVSDRFDSRSISVLTNALGGQL